MTESARSDIAIVGGCGHVGLPLGLAFARAGRRVVAVDIDQRAVESVGRGQMPFVDRGCDELLVRELASGRFRVTADSRAMRDAETVITVIGTPLDEHLNPRLEVYDDLIVADRTHLRSGQLLVLRSTVYPGTTERVARALAKAGLQIDVAFCPERVAQGVALEEITSLPQIVSGASERAQRRAEQLFLQLTGKVIATRPMEAELAKLFNNSWRYIQFAIANQFFMIANDFGLDFYGIRRAMTEGYPRATAFPGAGFAAGPCLFKDTMQLSSFDNNAFFLGHSAMLVNEGLPNYLVKRAAKRWHLSGMTAGILGMTFKGDSDDPRESLAFKLRKILERECREVLCSDPFLEQDGLVGQAELLERADLIFIGAPHSAYRGLAAPGKPLIDIWGVSASGISVV